MTTKKKQPWLKFYPGDWQSDEALRLCSIGARGLWIEMLCLMHKADGALLIKDRPVSARQLAGLLNVSVKDCEAYLAELREFDVYSVDKDGTIYSRRMCRDILKAERDRENGKGGGNPNLPPRDNPPRGGADNRGVNPHANGADKAQRLETRGQSLSGKILDVDRGPTGAVEVSRFVPSPDTGELRESVGELPKGVSSSESQSEPQPATIGDVREALRLVSR